MGIEKRSNFADSSDLPEPPDQLPRRIATAFRKAGLQPNRVNMISGVFNMGMGSKLEMKATRPMSAGSFMVMPKGMSNFTDRLLRIAEPSTEMLRFRVRSGRA